MLAKEAAKAAAEAYIPVSVKSLRLDTVLGFDLHIKINGEFVLYRASDTPFTQKSLDSLKEHHVDNIYVSSADSEGYQKYIESHLEEILEDETVEEKVKAKIVYDTAALLVKDVMARPGSVETVKRSMKLVEATVFHNLNNSSAFYNMLKVMQFNYSTYTHSINVCTFSLALAQFSGISDTDELNRLGLGALLHDVGKTRISESILNKAGPLTADEWKQIEKHPQYGFEIILETNIIPHDSHYPILQHHERENGSGYPHGRKSGEIHLFSKIVAIADVFDAMTTQRVYRNAVDTFPAMQQIYNDHTKFDADLVKNFTRMMGPREQDDET